MFKSKKETPMVTSTIIGNGIHVEGTTINGSGSLRIDGTVVADIKIDGNIMIGETGSIQGNMNVTHALIAGKVVGNILSSSTVHLTSSANIVGNIEACGLVIDEGAIFSGNCKMSSNHSNNALVYNEDKSE